MTDTQRERQPLLRLEEIEATPVYPIIHLIRADVMHYIDTPLTYEALAAPDLIYTLVRPLADKYIGLQQNGNMSIVFCLLLNRAHFLRDTGLLTSSLSKTRASLCELLAIRTLREYGDSLLDLATVTTTSWPVYSGADPTLLAQAREENDDIEDRVGNAIEMAIISKAKRFIKSSPCQKVIDAIWSGKCVYQADSSHSFLSDTYKRNPIHFYNPHVAPFLDHYRLKVPAIRSVLEYLNFLVLFILFIVAIELNEVDRLNIWEIFFMIYSLGFSLEKAAAMQEHGVKVFFTGTWNGFDVAFVTIYLTYAIFRLYGVFGPSEWARETGTDCLALIACLLFPRLAFVTLRNNLMVLSLRAMIVQFTVLMLIAAFCFGGFLYALWTFSRNEAGYGASQIAWWMLDLWFGLDATGFEKASEFNSVFGPLIIVTYACLSNTLLLTVLVSILSHTFTTINEDAAAEAMFRRAVSTIEGVKADSLFSYQPPINVFALLVLLPSSYLLTPRWFHKVNVFLIRSTNFPILVTISIYERQAKKVGATGITETIKATSERLFDSLPRLKRMPLFEGFMSGGGSEIDAIFELEDDMGSALDMQDQGMPPPIGRQRAISMTPRRSSGGKNGHGSSSNHSITSPVSSPKRDIPSITTMPRHRLTSILHEGAAEVARSVASPLAQIFQPVTIDEGIPEQDEQPRDAVSYGPASRRRRLSSSVRPSRPPHLDTQGSPTHFRRFPTGESPMLSESPEQHPSGSHLGARSPPTAGQIEEEDSEIGNMQWTSKLEEMEQRQKRMEELLKEIAGTMRKAL
ncbi:hypothetical protein OF83DRAFT_1091683 [Amylostereum chailletii]|nr:hypothetical protein OF83DRAFT_1091683 [Amylostereum chailletii]